MTLIIQLADFEDPALRTFLEEHLVDMAPCSPLESQHALDLTALQQPTVRLWVAWKEQRIAGTCALAALTPDHEELKSMRTDPDFRGQGVASELLRHVLANAKIRKVARISLETGSMEFFAPARALYKRNGFGQCQPFGSYIQDPYSIYMTRTLQLS
ncbi:GNAT family N-acetyltransferase [Pseudarthrobacter sp. PS3-L1]|uniref:GNAT family N-acetyltransferase n=1 Tax=Pseudarthrobacter sp. PS3-L1 TaxID=3046207 RepID=UPI0024BB41AA|nr:GNAT family N-acetyltransferase [Pseudarthrobacter sp. PS3-L1]MDJ0319906.1 GNAT family N-acetyltransferase [Pseudarthrobacter sp. PS3-L1]